ncbi:MAG: hypothetical protein PHX72_03180, partial [Candidatus Shapirobacteria bacterium]|nr:hypothetical protein [Candidatus Shapirobacteria bacterium]
NRYTDAETQQLITVSDYQFQGQDIILRPTAEFFARFFAQEGWKDGFHGLVLSALMAFYNLVIYLKVWEELGFKKELLPEKSSLKKITKDWRFWWQTFLIENEGNGLKKLYQKVIRKITSK